jgi:hypothetical protein
VLCKKSRATVLIRHRDLAAGLAGDLPLGRLHGPPGARRLACRAIVLLELATRPAQRGSLPTSTTYTTRGNAGVVECQLGLLPTFRTITPGHPADFTARRRKVARGSRPSRGRWWRWMTSPTPKPGPPQGGRAGRAEPGSAYSRRVVDPSAQGPGATVRGDTPLDLGVFGRAPRARPALILARLPKTAAPQPQRPASTNQPLDRGDSARWRIRKSRSRVRV